MIKIKFKFKFFAPFSELFIINFAITKVISAYVLTIAARSPGPTELKLHKKRSRAHCSVVTTKKKRSRAHCTNIEALGLEPTVQKLQRDHGASIAAGVPEPTVQVKTLREKGPGPTVQTLLQGTLSPLNNIPRGSRARVGKHIAADVCTVLFMWSPKGPVFLMDFLAVIGEQKILKLRIVKAVQREQWSCQYIFFHFGHVPPLHFTTYIIFHVPIPLSFCRLWPWLLTTITYPKFHRQFYTIIMNHCSILHLTWLLLSMSPFHPPFNLTIAVHILVPSSIFPDYCCPYPCSILHLTWLLLSISLFYPPFNLTIAVHILILSSI